jgi:hypothetical protein
MVRHSDCRELRYAAHRVLKSTGSLYLHCDPPASHDLKVIRDTILDHRSARYRPALMSAPQDPVRYEWCSATAG